MFFNINKALLKFFDEMINAHSADSSQVVGWSSRDTQLIRFKILTEIADLDFTNILDIGCGVGDLYPYLNEKFVNFSYQGIDIHPKMIKMAKEKFPDANFQNLELKDITDKYDYSFVSGAFNLMVTNNYRYLADQINYMAKISKKGFAFNLLSSYVGKEFMYQQLFYYDPCEVLKLCKNNFERVILRHDYLDNDFTIYIYK
jgi:SAM-dependent methyltransferase